MGEVYLAQHPRLPRRDALKILPVDVSSDDEFRRRFQREAALASKLWHPHIVGVHDRGEFDDQLWISMDFVDGLDAARLLGQRYPSGMPVEEVGKIVAAVASALDYAHKKGLLHRDVKPANIMLSNVDDDDSEHRILLTDFGIARNVDDVGWLTATNMAIGTFAYSAPEQLMATKMDGRADQYALAATAFHLLAGVPPFDASNPVALISQHLNSSPPRLSDRRPHLAYLDPVLSTALAKNPADRFGRCSDFAAALSKRATAGSAAKRKTASGRTGSASAAEAPTQAAQASASAGGGASGIKHHPPKSATGAASTKKPRRQLLNRYEQIVLTAVGVIMLVAVVVDKWATLHGPMSFGGSPSVAAGASSPRTASPVGESALDGLLLSPDQINAVAGTDDLVPANKPGRAALQHEHDTVQPPECLAIDSAAQANVYIDSGHTASRHESFHNAKHSHHVFEAVVLFPTAEKAAEFYTTSVRQWSACTGHLTTTKPDKPRVSWTMGPVSDVDHTLSVSVASENTSAACGRALSVKNNVAVDVLACDVNTDDAAVNIAHQIAAKVPD
jgi:serine/threonine-protein kinase